MRNPTQMFSRIQINRSIIAVIKAIASQYNYQDLSIKYKASDLLPLVKEIKINSQGKAAIEITNNTA